MTESRHYVGLITLSSCTYLINAECNLLHYTDSRSPKHYVTCVYVKSTKKQLKIPTISLLAGRRQAVTLKFKRNPSRSTARDRKFSLSRSLCFFVVFFSGRKVTSRNVTSLRLSRLSQLDSACELIKIGESIAN